MKLLVLLQANQPEDQIGCHDACLQLQQEGLVTDYKWLCFRSRNAAVGWRQCWVEAAQLANDVQPDVVFLQFFHDATMTHVDSLMDSLRKIKSQPTIFVTAGDGFTPGFIRGHPCPESFREVSRLSDMTFLSAMGDEARDLMRTGSKNIVLCPHGFCQRRHYTPFNANSYRPEFDISFIGSYHKGRNPFTAFYQNVKMRRRLIDSLAVRYGKRFAVFGKGWNHLKHSWQGPVAYANQVDAMRRSRIVFGGYPNCTQDYYASDRPYISLISGIPCVDFYVSRLDRLFRDGDECYFVKDQQNLLKTCDKLLDSNQNDLLKKSLAAAEYAKHHHSQYHRVRFMLQTAQDLRVAKLTGNFPTIPMQDFFLPEVDLHAEVKYSIMGWCGSA